MLCIKTLYLFIANSSRIWNYIAIDCFLVSNRTANLPLNGRWSAGIYCQRDSIWLLPSFSLQSLPQGKWAFKITNVDAETRHALLSSWAIITMDKEKVCHNSILWQQHVIHMLQEQLLKLQALTQSHNIGESVRSAIQVKLCGLLLAMCQRGTRKFPLSIPF